jgi:DNA-binding NarL/FixJ family response regulator
MILSLSRTIFKYGLISGLLIVLFAYLKSDWYLSGLYPDLYITVVAAVFILLGYYVSRYLNELMQPEIKMDNVEVVINPLGQLSRRELKVLEQLNTDLSNKEIAGVLCIGLSTLKTHINSIYKKLEVKNRAELRLKLKRETNSNMLAV